MSVQKDLKIENNFTILKFNCITCGKYIEIQTVWDVIIEECSKCFYQKERAKNE